jgi:hypothetical protein
LPKGLKTPGFFIRKAGRAAVFIGMSQVNFFMRNIEITCKL